MVIDIELLTSIIRLILDVLAILVIFLLFIKYQDTHKYYNNQIETIRKKNEEINSKYDNMVERIILGVNQSHLTPKESQNIALIEKQINDIINVILKDTQASRVCIVKYHNGNKDMTGKSFLKMSMTNEVVNIGVASMMGEFKDVFRSLLAYWCHEIETKSYCVIDDVENLKNIDLTMYQYLKTRNIEAKYGLPLKDMNNNTIGFMCIEFLDKNNFDIDKIYKSVNLNFPKIETLVAIDGRDM